MIFCGHRGAAALLPTLLSLRFLYSNPPRTHARTLFRPLTQAWLSMARQRSCATSISTSRARSPAASKFSPARPPCASTPATLTAARSRPPTLQISKCVAVCCAAMSSMVCASLRVLRFSRRVDITNGALSSPPPPPPPLHPCQIANSFFLLAEGDVDAGSPIVLKPTAAKTAITGLQVSCAAAATRAAAVPSEQPATQLHPHLQTKKPTTFLFS